MKTLNWLKEIRVLVWDVDGTFYNFHSVPEYQKLYEKYFFESLSQIWKIPVAKAKKKFNLRLKKEFGHTKTLASFGIEAIKFLEKKIYGKMNFNQLLKKDLLLKKNLAQLSFLDQGILTNNSIGILQRKLKALGIPLKMFKWIFTAYDQDLFKPNLAAFEQVLKTTNYLPQQHLYIGDSDAKDIIPAKKIGMRTCLVWGKSKFADISLPSVYDISKSFI